MKKRKVVLVERQVQGSLGWRIAAHWFLFLALSVSVTTCLQVMGDIESGSLWSRLTHALRTQIGPITVLMALLPWFIHDSLKLSNRFTGPMVRLRKSIIELTQQDSTAPVSFRAGDFWQDISADFNNLRARVLADRQSLAGRGSGRNAEAQTVVSPGTFIGADNEKTLPLGVISALPTAHPPSATGTA